MNDGRIPEISDEKLAALLANISPLVRKRSGAVTGTPFADAEKSLHRIKLPANVRDVSFIWDPELLSPVDERNLQILRLIPTYHTAGYIGLCKPTIAEVLAQIPEELVASVAAFEVCVDNGVVELIDSEYFRGHRLITILYQYRPAQV